MDVFFVSNDEICLLFGGKSLPIFRSKLFGFREGVSRKQFVIGELMCHQTERRTVLFVMNQNRVGCELQYMDVSENNGTPKSSILIGFSIINHPFWGTPIFGNTHMGKTNILHPLSKTSQLRLT